jgi:hypothetical protein
MTLGISTASRVPAVQSDQTARPWAELGHKASKEKHR